MSERELIEAVFARRDAESSAPIIDDLMRDDADWSLFGWHEFLPERIRKVWPKLSRTERIVAYAMADHSSRALNAYDE